VFPLPGFVLLLPVVYAYLFVLVDYVSVGITNCYSVVLTLLHLFACSTRCLILRCLIAVGLCWFAFARSGCSAFDSLRSPFLCSSRLPFPVSPLRTFGCRLRFPFTVGLRVALHTLRTFPFLLFLRSALPLVYVGSGWFTLRYHVYVVRLRLPVVLYAAFGFVTFRLFACRSRFLCRWVWFTFVRRLRFVTLDWLPFATFRWFV